MRDLKFRERSCRMKISRPATALPARLISSPLSGGVKGRGEGGGVTRCRVSAALITFGGLKSPYQRTDASPSVTLSSGR